MKSIISGHAYAYQGRIDLGYRTSGEAVQTAEESGDIHSKAWAYTYHGCSCYCRGLLQEAEGLLLKGIDLSESINLLSASSMGHLWLGETYFGMAEYKKSQHCYDEAFSLCLRAGIWPSCRNLCRIASARARVMDNDMDINLTELFKCHEDNRYESLESLMSEHIGEILLNIDQKHMSEAEDWIKKAIEADSRNGMMLFLAKDYAAYAELFKRKGDPAKAKHNLNKAIKIFEECGADGWVTRTQEALSGVSTKD